MSSADQARRYYAGNRQKKIAANDAYRKRMRARPEYRRMERECVRRWEAKNPAKVKEINRAVKGIRRARKRGAFVEPVYRAVVFQNYAGLCGICHQPIDPVEQWHLDHIIPLSKGGAHSYANTQPSHADCNVKKGATLPHPTPRSDGSFRAMAGSG